ncbi:hypothetical protein K3495_g2104 [Podosphaera aphanis]|nr:hypothetical protein K3495_g2104 [Podosphaera aphanis]
MPIFSVAASIKEVTWSDETNINWISSDGINYTWQRDHQSLQERDSVKTVKFGGANVMIQARMACSGPGAMA